MGVLGAAQCHGSEVGGTWFLGPVSSCRVFLESGYPRPTRIFCWEHSFLSAGLPVAASAFSGNV